MKKQFFVAAMALALGAGFTACSSDDLNAKGGVEQVQKGTTYMSVSFTLPTGMSTRAAADGQDKPAPDFNNVGKWEGQDKIKKVLVYVFDAANKLEVKQEYNGTDLAFTQDNTGSGKAVVTPNSAFKVLPGLKKVYVVLNPTTAAETLLPATVGSTTLAEFVAKYESDELHFTKPTRFGDNALAAPGSYVTTDETRAGEIAKVDGAGTSASDVILMTGEAGSGDIKDEVTATQAVSGQKNRVKLEVQRAVARVLVTTAAENFDIEGVNPQDPSATGFKVATISQLTYVVAQGEAKLYFQQKRVTEADGSVFRTPAFGVVNADYGYWTTPGLTDYATVGKNYDYSGLWKNTAGYANIKGVKVPTRTQFSSTAATELGHVAADLRDGLDGEFILPTLHKYVDKKLDNARTNTGYRKGNTAYILVRGLLKPNVYVKTDGTISTTAATEAKDWYLGANGFFYESASCIQDPTKHGVKGQTAQLYKGGKVLYFLWLNPDDVAKAVNSPTLRNNIYHVQIKGVGKIGANWNPLIPFDPEDPTFPGNTPGSNPNKPNDPADPYNPGNPNNPTFPKNPNNPDPRPDNPYEPKDPPVDPKDPLSFKETWMAVQVSILPWQVHSYEVVL